MTKRKGIRRRDFSKGVASASTLAALGATLTSCSSTQPTDSAADVTATFTHGVASGDPLADRVILWSRAVPEQAGPVSATWEIAENERFRPLISSGMVDTDAEHDYTMKIDAHGLEQGSKYYYRFRIGSVVSPVGTTRTLPGAEVSQVRLAVASCSNYPAGFFHAYRAIANGEYDAVLHLGDYIYEYQHGGYDSADKDAERLGRVVQPNHELLVLDDYRQRYAQYRSDPDLLAAHTAHPFIMVWDDHELANDTWRMGAENHQRDTEGRWQDRRTAAVKAWHEWMPVRKQPGHDRIWRNFQFGNLVNLMMIDTRVRGRDQQLEHDEFLGGDTPDVAGLIDAINSPNRSLLDALQRDWLYEGLEQSDATWQVLGQQVLMTKLDTPAASIKSVYDGDAGKGIEMLEQLAAARTKTPEQRSDAEQQMLDFTVPMNLDAWDGYGHERESLLRHAANQNSRLVSLAGDTHNAWAGNLRLADGTQAGIELACQGVSSPGFETYLDLSDPDLVRRLEHSMTEAAPELAWCNLSERGYMSVEFRADRLDAKWIFVGSVKEQTPQEEPAPPYQLTVSAADPRIIAVEEAPEGQS